MHKKKLSKHRKEVVAKRKAARKEAAHTNGSKVFSNIAPAPKDGPSLNLRMRSVGQIASVKAAAVKAGMSMNTWVCEVLEKAAEAQ